MWPQVEHMAIGDPFIHELKCRVPKGLKEELLDASARRGESVSVMIREAIRGLLEKDTVNFSRRNNSGVATAGTPEGSKMGTAGAELAPANLAEGAR